MSVKALMSGLVATTLTGCAMSTPVSSPNSDVAEIIADRDYMVIVTHATIASDLAERRKFFKLTGAVEESLGNTPGIVNFSKRANLLANEAWTLTVWEDEDAMLAFKTNRQHLNAISNAGKVLAGARFARFMVKGADLPVSWELALEQLELQNQGYETAYGG